MAQSWKIGLGASALLGVLGAGTLLLAWVTPWHSDADAYFAALREIQSGSVADTASFDRMSQAFHENQRRYATAKWWLADAGYLLCAWSMFVLLLSIPARRRGWGMYLRASTRPLVLAVATLAGVFCILLGLFGAFFHPAGRQQLPIWADTPGIPLMVLQNMGILLTPLFLVLTLHPLLFRPTAGGNLLMLWRRPHWTAAAVTILYAPFISFCLLALVFGWETGGWAYSVGGALLAWLLLNARALWLAPRR